MAQQYPRAVGWVYPDKFTLREWNARIAGYSAQVFVGFPFGTGVAVSENPGAPIFAGRSGGFASVPLALYFLPVNKQVFVTRHLELWRSFRKPVRSYLFERQGGFASVSSGN